MNLSDFRRPIAILKRENYLFIATDDYLPGLWRFDIKGNHLEFKSLEKNNIFNPCSINIFEKDKIVIFDSNSSFFHILDINLKSIGNFWIKPNIWISSMYYDDASKSLYCVEKINGSIFVVEMDNNFQFYTISSNNSLTNPNWITKDGSETLLIADSGNHRIIQYNLKTNKNRSQLEYGRNGNGKVRNPSCIIPSEKYFYVFDYENYLIQVFDKVNFNVIEQFGGKGHEVNQFDLPTSGFFDDNKLYIADRNNDRILRYNENTKNISEIISPSFVPGRLCRPVRVSTDSKDNIYIADRDNDCIQIFDKNNRHKSIVAKTNNGDKIERPSSVGVIEERGRKTLVVSMRGLNKTEILFIELKSLKSKRIKLKIKDPQDMIIDKCGNILVADTLNRLILHLDKNGNIIREIDAASISGNERILVKGICFGYNSDFLYADYDSCKIYIHKIGNGELSRIIDLSHYKTELHNIKSVTATPNKIILCTRGSHPIWVIDYKGKILKKIGEKGKGEYSFRNPSNVYIMNCGDILIVDKENDRIVRYSNEFNYITDFGSS